MAKKNYLALAFNLLDSIGATRAGGKEIPLSFVNESENRLGIIFPDEYKEFIARYGCIVKDDLVIFGLGVPRYFLQNVESAFLLAYSFCADAPPHLLPFHMVSKGIFACMDCVINTEKSRIILWDTSTSAEETGLIQLADSFGEYIYNITLEKIYRDKSLLRLENLVNKFASSHKYSHAKGGVLPSNHEWRPYRYCIQDVLFGSVVVKHDREYNRLKVDVFLTADIPEYDPLAPTQALVTFLLSEAYKCGGSMEIQFTKDVEGGPIPHKILKLAAKMGLEFDKAEQGLISAQEAKALYSAITGFSEEFRERLYNMEVDNLIKMVRACYVVHHGVWTREQVEMIVLGSERPDRILSGASQSNQRHTYQHDLLHARAAVMGGMFDRALSLRNRSETSGSTLELEDDFRSVKLGFDGTSYIREISCEEDLPIPWLVAEESGHLLLAGIKSDVLIRARKSIDLKRHLAEDLKQAIDRQNQTGAPTFLLVPSDFNELNEAERMDWLKKCRAAHVWLLVCPESTLNLDAEAVQKLSQSRILRQ